MKSIYTMSSIRHIKEQADKRNENKFFSLQTVMRFHNVAIKIFHLSINDGYKFCEKS